jgi:hypothetical protein
LKLIGGPLSLPWDDGPLPVFFEVMQADNSSRLTPAGALNAPEQSGVDWNFLIRVRFCVTRYDFGDLQKRASVK